MSFEKYSSAISHEPSAIGVFSKDGPGGDAGSTSFGAMNYHLSMKALVLGPLAVALGMLALASVIELIRWRAGRARLRQGHDFYDSTGEPSPGSRLEADTMTRPGRSGSFDRSRPREGVRV
jgi:hypothetical protein